MRIPRPTTRSTRGLLPALLAVAVAAAAPLAAGGHRETPDAVVTEFITGLDHLDLERVMATLSDDATMFFPHPDATYRLDGKTAIREEMARRFEAGRAWAERAGRTEPPYLGVVAAARDRLVQPLGADGAVVTWVVDRPGNFGRRAAVVRRTETGDWELVHFHSSNLTAPPAE